MITFDFKSKQKSLLNVKFPLNDWETGRTKITQNYKVHKNIKFKLEHISDALFQMGPKKTQVMFLNWIPLVGV